MSRLFDWLERLDQRVLGLTWRRTMRRAPRLPDQTATVRVVRERSGRRDRRRGYWVLLDGRTVGEVWEGETEDFFTTPGSHRLKLKIDWAGSQEFEFAIAEHEVMVFRCRPGGSDFSVLWQALFASNRYIRLERDTAQRRGVRAQRGGRNPPVGCRLAFCEI